MTLREALEAAGIQPLLRRGPTQGSAPQWIRQEPRSPVGSPLGTQPPQASRETTAPMRTVFRRDAAEAVAKSSTPDRLASPPITARAAARKEHA